MPTQKLYCAACGVAHVRDRAVDLGHCEACEGTVFTTMTPVVIPWTAYDHRLLRSLRIDPETRTDGDDQC